MIKDTFDTHAYHHLHNRGFEGRVIFSSEEDFNRFEAYLYLLNAIESPRVSNLFARGRKSNIFENARGEQLVAIASYAFTPKEFHLLAVACVEGGVAKFMQKLQTAYTMYFNHKYQRKGILFQSSYRSEYAESEEHLKYLHAFIHLFPAHLFNTEWRTLGALDLERVAASAIQYRYSSAGEYESGNFKITSPPAFPRTLTRMRDARSCVHVWDALKKTVPFPLGN